MQRIQDAIEMKSKRKNMRKNVINKENKQKSSEEDKIQKEDFFYFN